MPFPDVIREHTINRFLLRCQLQWELSACHLYVASTLAHLHCLAIRFYNDFKLFCPNNKIYGISVQPFFFFSSFFPPGKLTSSVLSLHQDCCATLNSLWKFYGFLTILPLWGHFDAKRYKRYILISFSQWLVFAGCFIKWVCISGKQSWAFLAQEDELYIEAVVSDSSHRPLQFSKLIRVCPLGMAPLTGPLSLRIKWTTVALNEDFWKNCGLSNTIFK